MFHSYYSDEFGNRYYLYDFKGAPERLIPVSLVTTPRAGRKQILNKLIRCCHTSQMRHILTNVLNKNMMMEYDLHHIHPLGMGGKNDFSNVCLIPKPLHEQLHAFLQIEGYIKDIKQVAKNLAQKNQKVFVNMPELPFIVTERDVPFLSQEPQCIMRAKVNYPNIIKELEK